MEKLKFFKIKFTKATYVCLLANFLAIGPIFYMETLRKKDLVKFNSVGIKIKSMLSILSDKPKPHTHEKDN